MLGRDSTGLTPALSADAWQRVEARLRGRPFLHTEGLGAPLEMPTTCAPWLIDQSRALVRRFDRFFRAIVDSPALADEPARRIGESYEAIADAEGDRPPLPLSRLDCVLDANGTLRVIELNPIGVCTIHLRGVSYLQRELVRDGDMTLIALAQKLDQFRERKARSMRRFIDATLAKSVERPTVALLLLPNNHRATKLVWKQELREAGLNVVEARPDQVRFTGDGAFVSVLGGQQRVDALWADWFIYLGYQKQRYEQTKFASKMGDYSSADDTTLAFITQPGFVDGLRERRFTVLSPMRAYRALSKALLAFIDHPSLALDEEERDWLRRHVAQTYDHHARQRLEPTDIVVRRRELVLKPCRFGGAHGVLIGADTDDARWEKAILEVWNDPEWVIQAFVPPVKSQNDQQLSYGVYNYQGDLGGVLVRSASQTIVGARSAGVLPAIS